MKKTKRVIGVTSIILSVVIFFQFSINGVMYLWNTSVDPTDIEKQIFIAAVLIAGYILTIPMIGAGVYAIAVNIGKSDGIVLGIIYAIYAVGAFSSYGTALSLTVWGVPSVVFGAIYLLWGTGVKIKLHFSFDTKKAQDTTDIIKTKIKDTVGTVKTQIEDVVKQGAWSGAQETRDSEQAPAPSFVEALAEDESATNDEAYDAEAVASGDQRSEAAEDSEGVSDAIVAPDVATAPTEVAVSAKSVPPRKRSGRRKKAGDQTSG